MSLTNFIPAVWSARLLQNLHTAHVFGQVVNRDYEGEITGYGDQVKINNVGAVTVGDYTKNTNIGDPETLTDAQRILLIDQSKYFNFQVDDIDKAQQNPKVMDEAMREAAYALNNVSDKFLAGFYVDALAANLIGNDTTPVVPTKADAYDYFVDLGTKLDEADVPADGRFAVIPPWYHGMLRKDDRFVGTGGNMAEALLRGGLIGEAAGFAIYLSNNVANTSGAKYKIMAGTRQAISFAEQIVSVEAYRPEKRFADAVKGLHVYGGKVVRPACLAVLTANKA